MKNIFYYSSPKLKAKEKPNLNPQSFFALSFFEDLEKTKNSLFKKYFPKYLKDLFFNSKDGSVLLKIKRTKIIHTFRGPPGNTSSYWRSLFSNKNKSIKALNSNAQSPFQLAPKITFFPLVQSLRVMMPKPQSGWMRIGPDAPPEIIELAFKKMKRLTNLKYLDIKELSTKNKICIDHLASSKQFLSSLTTFKIHFDSARYIDEHGVLDLILPKKSLLMFITCLKLGKIGSPGEFSSFQGLANSCPNLTSLFFDFSCPSVAWNKIKKEFEPYQLDRNYLSTMATFKNLKVLDLTISDLFTFFKDFALPPSVQRLNLYFSQALSHDILLRIDENFTDTEEALSKIFEENPLFLRFYEVFQPLQELKVLQLYFGQTSDRETFKYHSALCNSLLKRTPTLEKLIYIPFSQIWTLVNPSVPEMIDAYLSQFLGSCQHLGKTLKDIEIGHEKVKYSKVDFLALRNKFSKLKAIKITGMIDEAIGSFLEEVSCLGDSITEINLCSFIENNTKALLSLLQQVKKFQRKTREMSIDLRLKFLENKDLEGSKTDFEEAIGELEEVQKGNLRVRGVSLKIFTGVFSEEMKEFLKVYGEEFDNFEVVSKNVGFSDKWSALRD